jgi:hypothetical protein
MIAKGRNTYSLTVMELIARPFIRGDQPYEWMNKMSDEELDVWEKEAKSFLKEDCNDEPFALINEEIDRDMLYRLYKLFKTKN